MHLVFAAGGAAVVGAVLGSCTRTPDMPSDYSLPVTEIVRHTICELRGALQSLKTSNPSFQADQWAIAISLTPRADAEITTRLGATGRSSGTSPPQKYFNTWTIGTAPGAQIDVKGSKYGSASYTLHSKQLLNEKKYPLDCDYSAPNYHALTQQLGIQQWLVRTNEATYGEVGALTSLDKPTFTAQIFIRMDGTGSYTYNFPLGTDFFSLYAGYTLDETLGIVFTPDPDVSWKKKVRTLPSAPTVKDGGFYTVDARRGGKVSPEAKNRLDGLQLEQILRSLQTTVPRRQ